MTTTTAERRSLLLAAVVLGAVLAPVRQSWRARPRDGFPLSSYPMFSAKRRARVTVHSMVAVHADGSRRRLPHHYGGGGGGNQVRKVLNHAATSGRAEQVCSEVAARLAPGSGVVAVQLVAGRYRLDSCFVEGELRGAETVLGTVHCGDAVPTEVSLAEREPLADLALRAVTVVAPAEATATDPS